MKYFWFSFIIIIIIYKRMWKRCKTPGIQDQSSLQCQWALCFSPGAKFWTFNTTH